MQPGLGRSQENHPAGFAQAEGALHVIRHKCLFQTQGVWGPLINHGSDTSMHNPESFWHGLETFGRHHATSPKDESPSPAFHKAPTRPGRARINA
jgi:hypothetical protein